MATIIASTGRPATREELQRGAPWLTADQLQRMLELPEDHTVVNLRRRAPIVRHPDGQLSRLRPSGSLVCASAVESVQSYLEVQE